MAFTPYPDVDALLRRLLAEAPPILGSNFTGLYLYGSLALGDFDPAMSDIDFLAVVKEEVDADQLKQLGEMHRGIFESGAPLATELEGSYIPVRTLRRYDPADVMHPHVDRGEDKGLGWERHDTDWVVRYWMVRERGIVLAGPPPKELIDPISARDLKRAVVDMMWWWEQQLEDTHRVEQDGYQWYTVQTMCRIRYTMETGKIVSKPAASRWALEKVDPRWHQLIRHAMEWRPPGKMDRLEETLDFVRDMLQVVEERARTEGLR